MIQGVTTVSMIEVCNRVFLSFFLIYEYPNYGQSDLQPYHPCGYPGLRPLYPLTAHTPRQPTIYIRKKERKTLLQTSIMDTFVTPWITELFKYFWKNPKVFNFKFKFCNLNYFSKVTVHFEVCRSSDWSFFHTISTHLLSLLSADAKRTRPYFLGPTNIRLQ